tara:strand:+ start:26 stop:523 length:498 start_codon:yes stop_codon:yes gene_type:complete
MQLEAGHVAAWLEKGELPPSTQWLFDQLYEFTTASEENAYVLDHFEPKVVRLLIACHYLKNTLIYHTANGKIDGLVMWYRCNDQWDWDDIVNWTPDDPEGNCYFLAFLWAKGNALRRMTLELIDRQPEVIRGRLFGCRERQDGPRVVEYDQRLLVKILQKNGRKK